MDNFENIIEKYQNELMEFMKANPQKQECGEVKDNNALIDNDYQNDAAAANANIEDIEESEIIQSNSEGDTEEITEFEETVSDSDTREIPSPAAPVPLFDNYEDFLKNNSQKGSLRVQVYAADRSFPVVNARVTVFLILKDGAREMFDGLTDINGVVDNIILPAPEASMSQQPSDSQALPYSTYTTLIEHPEFVNAKYLNVPVFSGIKSIQGVEMIPLVSSGGNPAEREYDENQSFTRLKGDE